LIPAHILDHRVEKLVRVVVAAGEHQRLCVIEQQRRIDHDFFAAIAILILQVFARCLRLDCFLVRLYRRVLDPDRLLVDVQRFLGSAYSQERLCQQPRVLGLFRIGVISLSRGSRRFAKLVLLRIELSELEVRSVGRRVAVGDALERIKRFVLLVERPVELTNNRERGSFLFADVDLGVRIQPHDFFELFYGGTRLVFHSGRADKALRKVDASQEFSHFDAAVCELHRLARLSFGIDHVAVLQVERSERDSQLDRLRIETESFFVSRHRTRVIAGLVEPLGFEVLLQRLRPVGRVGSILFLLLVLTSLRAGGRGSRANSHRRSNKCKRHQKRADHHHSVLYQSYFLSSPEPQAVTRSENAPVRSVCAGPSRLLEVFDGLLPCPQPWKVINRNRKRNHAEP